MKKLARTLIIGFAFVCFLACSKEVVSTTDPLLLPPVMPENVSQAYEYALFVIIGHEFTHGFDNNGSQYDKLGNQKNWWTVADKMAFEDRRDNLVACYNHMELDPERRTYIW